MVDVALVQRKLSQLDTYLQQVSEFSSVTLNSMMILRYGKHKRPPRETTVCV
jgi:hypothetical protein